MVGYSNQTRVNWATSQNLNPYQTFGTGPSTLQDCTCNKTGAVNICRGHALTLSSRFCADKTTAGYGPPSSSGGYYAYLTSHKASLAPGEALVFEYGYAFS